MSDATISPEVEQSPLESKAKAAPAEATDPSKPPVSPAADLREIQQLLLGGMFPGNVAPSILKAFHLLDAMAKKVEEGVAANEAKNKA